MNNFLTVLLTALSSIAFGQSTISKTITHSTGVRSYQLYVPASYDGNTSVPLVFNLHGYGSNNTQQMAYGNFKPIADTANFLIVAPQGLNDGTGTSHWNAQWGTGVNDVSFISDLIDSISLDYNINPDRVYSTGMSNGGFMSFTLAGELSNKIAAVASVTGTMSVIQVPANTVTRPVPVMQIHGTADPTVAYNGDQYFLSVDSVINYWVDHNNCSSTPVITAIANTSISDGCTAEKYEFLNGDNGSEVVHYKITDGAHTWPGAAFTIAVTNQDFDASIEIWKFFSRYEKSSLVSVEHITKNNWIKLNSKNPTDGKLSFMIDKENVELFVYDIEGKLIFSQNYNDQEVISLSNYNNGVYLFHFRAENEHVSSFKIIKQ